MTRHPRMAIAYALAMLAPPILVGLRALQNVSVHVAHHRNAFVKPPVSESYLLYEFYRSLTGGRLRCHVFLCKSEHAAGSMLCFPQTISYKYARVFEPITQRCVQDLGDKAYWSFLYLSSCCLFDSQGYFLLLSSFPQSFWAVSQGLS